MIRASIPTTTDILPSLETADRIWPPTTQSIIAYPNKMMILRITMSLLGHQPNVYRAKIYGTHQSMVQIHQGLLHTKVRFPDIGPQVAIYATGRLPTIDPNTAHKDASWKLSVNTVGPSIPRVILLAAKLIENQRRKD